MYQKSRSGDALRKTQTMSSLERIIIRFSLPKVSVVESMPRFFGAGCPTTEASHHFLNFNPTSSPSQSPKNHHPLTSASRPLTASFLCTPIFAKEKEPRHYPQFHLNFEHLLSAPFNHKMAPHFSSPPPPHPPTLDSEPFSRPRPRPPRSSSQQAQIRVQNRRREYLARTPSYFESSEHELAGEFPQPLPERRQWKKRRQHVLTSATDPLLYDTLIRRHQTPAEREAEGRARGYSRVLEGSLLRGEERLARLAGESRPARPESLLRQSTSETGTGEGTASTAVVSLLGGVDEALPPPGTKTEGHAQWMHFLRERFIRGEDEDFEYATVDGDEELDVIERVEREEAWFDGESPAWDLGEEEEEGGDDSGDGDGDINMDGEGEDEKGEEARAAKRKEKELQGETGVQDF